MIVGSDSEASRIVQRIIELCLFRGLRFNSIRLNGNINGYLEILVERGETCWLLRIEDFKSPFEALPQVWLLEPTQILAHVSHFGKVCINDEQGLSIDESNSDEIRAHVAVAAIEILVQAEIDAASGSLDLFDEIEGYWEGISNAYQVRSSVEVDEHCRLIYAHFDEKRSPRKCIYFTETSGGNTPPEFNAPKLTNHVGLYLSLKSNVYPPMPGKSLDSSFVNNLLASLPLKSLELWEDQLRHRWNSGKKLIPLLISQPRRSGGRSLIGVTFFFNNGKLDNKEPVIPLFVKRHNPEFMRLRGGANGSLASKHIVVLGCGSVGSEVADALASTGIGTISLVDHEFFEVENVYRHVLGRSAIGRGKAEALKNELIQKYSDLKVNSFPTDVHQWVKAQLVNGIDGIIVAIGQPMVERHLVNEIRETGLPCLIVVTWLEPLGLGGHAISLSNSTPGCLGCLYRGDPAKKSLTPCISFLEPNQKVSRNLTGCTGGFIPYSALHSRRTALLATEAMLILLDGGPTPSYSFWVGDPKHAAQAGIRTSKWFEKALITSLEDASKHLFETPCSSCTSSR